MIDSQNLLEKIEGINNTLSAQVDKDSLDSLYNNFGGIVLFKCYYSFYKNTNNKDDIKNIFQYFFEEIIFNRNYDMSFSWGLSGIAWLMLFTKKQMGINIAGDFFKIVDANLLPAINTCAAKKDYDMFRGLLGINQYLSNRKTNEAKLLRKRINIEILSMVEMRKNKFTYYDYFHNKAAKNRKVINLGIAHGMPSLIHYFIVSIKDKINPKQCKFYLHNILKALEDYKDIDGAKTRSTKSVYPSYIEQYLNSTEEPIENSRLGWCYGDLGIGFMSYKAGLMLGRPSITDSGLEVLKLSTLRRSQEETLVVDPGFCHGTAGLSHIYNKLWINTRDPIFKEATEFWINETLNYLTIKGGKTQLIEHNQESPSTSNGGYGLLNGIAGIGLMLLSYLTNDNRWDECFMLDLPPAT